jgi:hypothetical protein
MEVVIIRLNYWKTWIDEYGLEIEKGKMFPLWLKPPFEGRNGSTWNVLIRKKKGKICVFTLRMCFGLNVIEINFK